MNSSAAAVRPIESRSVVEQVMTELRQSILSGDSHHAFHLALLAPAATSWDIRILGTLWRAAERYVRIGWGRLDPDPHEHARREQHHVELVSAFRQRDPEIASGAVHQHLSRNEQMALLALGSGTGRGVVAPVS